MYCSSSKHKLCNRDYGTNVPPQSRSNTPRSTPAPPAVEPPKPTPTRVVDAFPEFKAAPDYDACSFVDDSMSITTSTEDESNFEIDIVPEEDDLDLADIAEDAATIDDAIISDRIYKVLMAKQGNILVVDLVTVLAIVNVYNKNTLVMGKVEKYVTFSVSAPSDTSISHVEVNVNKVSLQLDDEIVSHLAAFALDEEVTENKVHLVIKVCDTNVEIRDRKKKKPMRLKIKQCVIEQEEDGDDT
ncbi:unnamed protein product [Strongylus vulgaris]|uniref:Uncharacterized protein n=1 Tax=Strongylus vulgaris TaxID=40348 RepID=A0A3P7J7F3_STRVU|nr:unnamed protein product [Strongylus vulgaris]